jgi:hypothetical protein
MRQTSVLKKDYLWYASRVRVRVCLKSGFWSGLWVRALGNGYVLAGVLMCFLYGCSSVGGLFLSDVRSDRECGVTN